MGVMKSSGPKTRLPWLLLLILLLVILPAAGVLAQDQTDEKKPPAEQKAEEQAPPPIDKERYQIGPADVLQISVWEDESLRRDLIVPPDRIISFPLVGDIDITGMNTTQLREAAAKKIQEFVPDATVTVMLLQVNDLKAYVIGKVARPGQFPIGMETTVLQFLAMAGGLTPFAAAGKIMVLRQEGGKTIKLPFDYNEVEKGRNLEQNVILKRGDVIVVP